MPSATPAVSSVVLYAKDKGKVARFYRRILMLEVIDEQDDFVVLGCAEIEVNVVRMSEASARSVSIASPPVPRESTAIKPSFLVPDLAQARAAAQETGGDTKDLAKAWRWRGQLHLDGYDPDGNARRRSLCRRVPLPAERDGLTAAVQGWRKYWPAVAPLPHPSPTNNGWLARNAWFERELVPLLRARVAEVLRD